MTSTSVDQATGNLVVAGRPVFPIVLSDPPPRDGTAPNSGLNAWAEIAAAGATFVRNYTVWTADGLPEQRPASATTVPIGRCLVIGTLLLISTLAAATTVRQDIT
jgi:hypothetical protein